MRVTHCLTLQVYQTKWKEGPPHLHRVPGLPPGALPWPHGERSCEEGRLRLPPGLRALSGTLQNALQTNLAPLERTCQVMPLFTPNQRLIVWLLKGSVKEILSVDGCQNTSVDTDECSRVSLTKTLNPRMYPGEWLCPALISCSGQLPGVMVWMWSRLQVWKKAEIHFTRLKKPWKTHRIGLNFAKLFCILTYSLSLDKKHCLIGACQTFGASQEKKHCAPTASKQSAVSGTNVIFVAMSEEITPDLYEFTN